MNAHRLAPTALTLALIAGAAASAQQATQPRQGDQQQQMGHQQHQPGRTEAAASGVMLVPSEWALGADILGSDGESIGTLNDLVLDVRGGRITHALVSHGAVLGIGGKLVALPWQSLKWNSDDRNFTIALTADQLKNAPEINKSNIGKPRGESGRFGLVSMRGDRAQPNAWSARGEYQNLVQSGQPANVRGAVTSIDRIEPMQGMQEGIIITIGENGRETTVHLGPAWFIDRQDVMLRLNDQVEVEGVQAEIDGQNVVVARTISSPHGRFRLRDEQNKPVWDASLGQGAGQQEDNRPQSQRDENQRDQDAAPRTRQVNQPLNQNQQDRPNQQNEQQTRQSGQPAIMPVAAPGGNQPVDEQAIARSGEQVILVSDVEDQTLRTAGEDDLGDIEAVVFDALSGKAAFVVVGVGGFLGLGETRVAIPWSLIRLEPDNRLMAMNVDRDTLKNAPRIEGANWDQLNDRAFTDRVYQHFGQPNPLMGAAPGQMQQRQQGQQQGWQGGNQYTQLFTSGQPSQVTGTIRTVSQAQPAGMNQPILVVFIEDESGNRRTVHMAPRNFLDDNDLTIEQGNQLTIHGRLATVDGEQVLIASRVQKEGKTLELRGDDGAPKWSAEGR
jgi:uncharacterized protein YrrD